MPDALSTISTRKTAQSQRVPTRPEQVENSAGGFVFKTLDAKLVVVALTPTEFTIADPSDAGMLDVSGFDSAVPGLIGDFSAGRV